jgi:CRISPR-associated endonuclease/helicase Cas3
MGELRLPSGEVLTEEMIEAMAAEAEAGFDPSQFRPRPIARSPQAEEGSFLVQYYVEPPTFEALLARAREENRSVSEIARTALERYLREASPPAGPNGAAEAGAPAAHARAE